MKREFCKKLTLKKQTVADMDGAAMNAIQAGAAITKYRTCSCQTYCPFCDTLSNCGTACNSNPCC